MRFFKRNKAGSRSFTRIFFTTDVHGSETAFRKFVNAAEHYQAGAIVLGGDITGKLVISIIRGQGRWEADLFGQIHVAETEGEVADLERIIRTNGFYPYRTTSEEVEELHADPAKVDALFTRLMKESVARWMQIAEDRLAGKGVGCFICLGNDDRDDVIPIIEQSEVVTYSDGTVIYLDDQHEMASCGYSNMTPWHCPRDVTEEELAKKIEAVVSQVDNLQNCIFNFHVPPYDSNLDLAPELDEELKPVQVGGQPKIVPVGSTAVRDAIERHQPMLGLHGHIHECRGVSEIGRTVCINPGSEYSEGVLRGVLVNFRDGKLLSHQFVAG